MKKLLSTIALSLFCIFPTLLAQLSHDFSETDEQQKSTEMRLKAAYIYNFGKFFHFPNLDQQEKFVIGVVGEVPELFKFLKYIEYSKKKIQGKDVVVKKFQPNAKGEVYHMLYVAEINPEKVVQVTNWIQDKPILTIGDNTATTFSAGLQLCISNNKLKMQIDRDLIAATGIGLESKAYSSIFESCSAE